jgi:DNA ligase D-like protein (predicted ligase)
MKAVLSEDRPGGDGWVFERKLDGIRCVAIKRAGKTRLLSRNNLPLDGRFPEIAAALDRAAVDDVLLDGEAVAFVGEHDSFAGLARQGMEPTAVFYYVFDLVRVGDEAIGEQPLHERRARLERLMKWRDPLRLTEQMTGDGAQLLARACEDGWEGLIAKRVDSPYVSARSRDWLKLKCTREQEFVIGGWTAPRGSRTDLGALLVGHFEDGDLRYAGKVGTGFDRATLRDLAGRLAPLGREQPPFEDEGVPRHANWVEPVLVAQIGFSEWTRDGRLRHPRFIGLREDKDAREVVRES